MCDNHENTQPYFSHSIDIAGKVTVGMASPSGNAMPSIICVGPVHLLDYVQYECTGSMFSGLVGAYCGRLQYLKQSCLSAEQKQ